jgi:hypothetical protein
MCTTAVWAPCLIASKQLQTPGCCLQEQVIAVSLAWFPASSNGLAAGRRKLPGSCKQPSACNNGSQCCLHSLTADCGWVVLVRIYLPGNADGHICWHHILCVDGGYCCLLFHRDSAVVVAPLDQHHICSEPGKAEASSNSTCFFGLVYLHACCALVYEL